MTHVPGNPLACGCEMAWLVTNEDLMQSFPRPDPNWGDIFEPTTCADGTDVRDLDPDLYAELC